MAANQFAVTIDCKHVDMSGDKGKWTPYYDYYFNKAFSRLKTRGAIAVYFYLAQQVPHYQDGKKFSGRKGNKPFYFSPAAIEKEMGVDKRTAQAGWKELVRIGYLVERKPNHFYFKNILDEDIVSTSYIKEKEGSEYEEALTLEEIQSTLPIYLSDQNNNSENKEDDEKLQSPSKICEWMTEEEKKAVLARANRL